MITLPPTLTPIKYPGYYWCVETNRLFPIKIGGVLREIKKRRVPKHVPFPGDFAYSISHEGKSINIPEYRLQNTKLKDYEVPYGKTR